MIKKKRIIYIFILGVGGWGVGGPLKSFKEKISCFLSEVFPLCVWVLGTPTMQDGFYGRPRQNGKSRGVKPDRYVTAAGL